MSTHLPSSHEDAERLYLEREQRFGQEREALNERWNRIGNLRLFTFLLALVGLGWGLWAGATLLWVAGLMLLVLFGFLVWHHNGVGRARREAAELAAINSEALMRSRRDWASLPLRHNVAIPLPDPYSRDLNIFGHASLFHLVDTAGTLTGERTLVRWLSAAALPADLEARQQAVRELAPRLDLRDALYLRGRLMSVGEEKPDPGPFLAWASSAPILASRRWLSPVAYISVALFWALAVAHATGLIAYPLWFPVAAANFIFSLSAGRAIYERISQVNAGERAFKQYAEALHLLSDAELASPCLRDIQARLAAGGAPAHTALRGLQRLVNFTIPPSAQLYFPLQAVTLWDVHLLRALERWQARHGAHASGWLDALGEFEALSSLAALLHANPRWAFPTVRPGLDRLEAVAMGHPLLANEVRVPNDVTVGPPATFLLVTGSNMSGKSTLLRSIGVNIVLAQAGGPVCAAAMDQPPLLLWTSMRIEDSLERGVSYFMAELERLKEVVEAARKSREGGSRLFYLLDEILQGTNTAERSIAARRVIHYLLESGALGAVSTHDLSLAGAPELAEAVRAVHFTETVHGDGAGLSMTFDYKLRPGVATSSNALKLMDIVFGGHRQAPKTASVPPNGSPTGSPSPHPPGPV